ncbi:MAG TPA: cation:proton antiporter [Firmicutes bacterium]|nr:MAG: cation:proton antiporter [Candidatus Omnitrophota bacterium]HDD65065.1 cation:proton antiporter [Bacillota bacterium]
MIYYLVFIVFLIGLYGVCCKKNIIKIILGLSIMEYAVNLFLILLGYRKNGIPPILEKGMSVNEFAQRAVDPLPQALVLTSIVIGLGTLALMVAIAIRIYQRYGTFDITEIKKLKG